MSGKRWSAIHVFGMVGIGIGGWGAFATIWNFAMGFEWAVIHGVETPALLSSAFASLSLGTLPYLALCAVGIGSLQLRRWAWQAAVFFVPAYLLCDAFIVRAISLLPEDWFDWLKMTLPAILFSAGSVWFLTRPRIRVQFAARSRESLGIPTL